MIGVWRDRYRSIGDGDPVVIDGRRKRQVRRRMVCICAPLGFYPPNFFPEQAGGDYELTTHLELLREYLQDFTVISGLMHTGNSPGFAHQATASFLTGAEEAGRAGFRNSISLDQFAAEKIGDQTCFPTLTLFGEGLGLAWTRTGAHIPADNSPSSVFARLFLKGADDDVQAHLRRLEEGRSILDDVRSQAADLRWSLGTNDREKLDEYMTSVRDLERRLHNEEQWCKRAGLQPANRDSSRQVTNLPHAAKRYIAIGDLIMPDGALGYAGSINFSATDVLASLRKLDGLRVDFILPGHGPITGPDRYVAAGFGRVVRDEIACG